MVKFSVWLPILVLSAGVCSAADFQDFAWSSGKIGNRVVEKTAIYVPLKIDGSDRTLFAQLDTGADRTTFHGRILRKHGVTVDSSGVEPIRFSWYASGGDVDSFDSPAIIDWHTDWDVNPDSKQPSDLKVGNIGLDLLAHRILILDFPGSRYAVLSDTNEVESLLSGPVSYVDGLISYDKFYVNVVLGTDTLKGVRFDSGSSIACLILPLNIWQNVTGLSVDDDAVVKDSVPSWGRYIKTWSAPAKCALEFGVVGIMSPNVLCVDFPDPNLRNEMLMGNAAFYDRHTVVVDCIRQKFGIYERK